MSSTIRNWNEQVNQLRLSILMDEDGDGVEQRGFGAFAEQHILLALAELEAAQRHLSLADLFMTRERGSAGY